MYELSEEAAVLYRDELFYTDTCMDWFILIHEVIVHPDHRRQGLGKRTYVYVMQGKYTR